MYRNPIEKVAEFLNKRHGEKYWLINTAERATYDKKKHFGNRATEYHWPDHHGPPFHYCFKIAEEMNNWLKADPDNVIIVHCNSGKGRTGTGICAFLLFAGFFGNVDDCLKFYGY
jgi:protein-tyrosine phosphatase